MSIYFAGARRQAMSPLARCLRVARGVAAVNDNYGPIGAEALVDNPLLRATLQHFANHGLSAASHARSMAEAARLVGETDAYRHWMGVCRLLDRRMAGRGSGPDLLGTAQRH